MATPLGRALGGIPAGRKRWKNPFTGQMATSDVQPMWSGPETTVPNPMARPAGPAPLAQALRPRQPFGGFSPEDAEMLGELDAGGYRNRFGGNLGTIGQLPPMSQSQLGIGSYSGYTRGANGLLTPGAGQLRSRSESDGAHFIPGVGYRTGPRVGGGLIGAPANAEPEFTLGGPESLARIAAARARRPPESQSAFRERISLSSRPPTPRPQGNPLLVARAQAAAQERGLRMALRQGTPAGFATLGRLPSGSPLAEAMIYGGPEAAGIRAAEVRAKGGVDAAREEAAGALAVQEALRKAEQSQTEMERPLVGRFTQIEARQLERFRGNPTAIRKYGEENGWDSFTIAKALEEYAPQSRFRGPPALVYPRGERPPAEQRRPYGLMGGGLAR